jgi:hypothetical protein
MIEQKFCHWIVDGTVWHQVLAIYTVHPVLVPGSNIATFRFEVPDCSSVQFQGVREGEEELGGRVKEAVSCLGKSLCKMRLSVRVNGKRLGLKARIRARVEG